MKKKFLKIVAAFLAVNILAEIITPTMAFALTAGPSQPEVESFEPVETTEMVDPFTGDFTYNIPLMTVPGPNGGYPINLSYHAGIGMEQEASWVGLGWNINPGVITRNMRGLPDDFNGEEVIKTLSHKPNWTFGLAMNGLGGGNTEVFGAETDMNLRAATKLYYNNYKGVGVGFGMNLNNIKHKENSPWSGAIDWTADSQTGVGVTPSISYTKELKDSERAIEGGLTYHSREGIQKLWIQATEKKNPPEKKGHYLAGRRGAGVSFNGSSYIPGIMTPLAGGSADFKYKFGGSVNALFAHKTVRAFFSIRNIKDKTLELPAFGYMHSENRSSADDNTHDDMALMDFNREREHGISKESPALPMPVFTHDVFAVKGQGVGSIFRPYRSDIGVLYDSRAASDFGGAMVGLEPSSGHMGGNYSASYSHSYSGKWKDSWPDLDDAYEFKSKDNNHLFEPFYFRAAGEMAADDGETARFGGDNPVKFRIRLRPGNSLTMEPKVFNKYEDNNSHPLLYNKRNTRAPRSQSIEHKTREQIALNPGLNTGKYIFNINQFPNAQTQGSPIDYSTGNGRSVNHIAEMSVVNPDGNRYVYGLPAYNTKQKEALFSVDPTTGIVRTVSYASTDASTTNDKGRDHLYSSTELPPYAHSYLLTTIYSPDYIDLKGDGPTEDDFGYYVKFNYTRVSAAYKWRIPFTDANYIRGYYSDDGDDKAMYTYGEKEIWMLNSVETKTHIAEFWLKDRTDGMGAEQEHNASSNSDKLGDAQKALDEIRLYSKLDRTVPIKTVKFIHDYSLCLGVDNNSSTNPTNDGKLTLKEVRFTYRGSNKGALSPYKFEYVTGNGNPKYNLAQMDRWGNYKPDNYLNSTWYNFNNEDDPYVTQNNKPAVDEQAAAWCLKKITLPSGGDIVVDYESDDYAYVQEKPAMQMFRILHTGDANGGSTTGGSLGRNGGNYMERIYFELETPTNDPGVIQDYIKGIDLMYFKAMMRLKRRQDLSGTIAYDYVDGYCKIDPGKCGVSDLNSNGDYTKGYITVMFVPAAQTDYSGGKVHPFRKAAWEYMKLNRTDLLYPDQSSNEGSLDADIINAFVSIWRDSWSMIFGYYNFCLIQNFASEILLDETQGDYRPSFIRLNSPDRKKLGGGHRVKAVTMYDNWDAITTPTGNLQDGEAPFDYGQEFIYTLADGSSSGVAEYEPLIGGEEIPHRMPTDRFRANRTFLSNDKEFYLEHPYGESYYPGANVGYSRVIVKNKTRKDANDNEINKKTASGYLVYEFYTARDFPVKVTPTDVDHKEYSPSVIIPFFGTQDFDNNGYSQGYVVELNDMHGKTKAISSYAYGVDLEDPLSTPAPVTKTEHIYNTTAPYNPNGENKLLNVVTVLDGDAQYRQAVLGQTTDFFIDMVQHSDFTVSPELKVNVDIVGVPPTAVPVLTYYPGLEYSEGMFRSIVTNKVISRNGILMEVRATNDASTITTRNLMFDAATGTALLTSVTNNFDAPVYNYTYAAHWAYDNMGGAYKNIGATFRDFSTNGNGEYLIANPSFYFTLGDEVEVVDQLNGNFRTTYWVSQIGSDRVTLINANGVLAANLAAGIPTYASNTSTPENARDKILVITRSGRRNQQGISNGKIVSLTNPVLDRNFPLLEQFNVALQDLSQPYTSFDYKDCLTGENVDVTVSLGVYDGGTEITFTTVGTTPICGASIRMKEIVSESDLRNYLFYKRGEVVVAVNTADNPDTESTCEWWTARACFNECLDGVLHAEAARFKDTWTFNYTDVGNPVVDGSGTLLSSVSANNPYRYGTSGIWRNESSYLYQVDREQTTPKTDISKDGVYKHFVPYNWEQAATNPQWSFVSAVTRYNPYGFEVENKDALNRYSSALYGYNNSVVTAIAANSSYFETAFEGFEDYTGNLYYNSAYPQQGGHGHLNLKLNGSGNITNLYSGDAHTGNVCLSLNNQTAEHIVSLPASNPDYFAPLITGATPRKYVVSAWFKPSAGSQPQILVKEGATIVAQSTVPVNNPVIEGWQRIELVFNAPVSTYTGDFMISFGFTGGGLSGYVDDIRVHPFNSTIKSFVYDPETLWLLAELDNQNFATFYNYDEEGSLVQVKKETVNGIMTLKSSRNNIKRP